jgi:two-component system chemotaxis response regulator CheB
LRVTAAGASLAFRIAVLSPKNTPATRDIVVIGASAGGLAVLCELVRGLPRRFPAAVFVAVHTSADNPGVLPQILARFGPLPVAFARDGERIEHGRIYVAPPDHHLLIERDRVRVTHGPKENGFRPAVDPLFRTAARSYGPRAVGLVLSGALNDGTHGLSQIVEAGGVALAQDPQEALIPSMPLSAIQNVEVRRVLRSAEIAAALADVVRESVEDPDCDAPKAPEAALDGASLQDAPPPGAPSGYTCPECGGAMWEINERGRLLRYRCHVGHGFTAETLIARQGTDLEAAMWTALRALEEHIALCRRLAERAGERGLTGLAARYHRDADEGALRADVIRDALERALLGASNPLDGDAIEQMHPADVTPLAPPAPLSTPKSQ